MVIAEHVDCVGSLYYETISYVEDAFTGIIR